MKILARLQKSKNTWFLLFVLFLFFLLRLPSLFEPYWYKDEGIYQTIGLAIKNGQLLYRDIWDNKPPLLYLVYSFFNSDQFATKSASLIFGALSVLIFFFIAKKLFEDKGKSKICFLSTVIFTVLLGLPIIEGNIANAENFMLLPILIAGFLILNLIKSKNNLIAYKKFTILNSQLSTFDSKLFLAGVFLGIAFLFKIVAIFDLIAFLIILFSAFLPQSDSLKNINKILKKIIFLPVGFSIPIVLTALFFVRNNALKDFIQATLTQNISYVTFGNIFLITHGLLLLKIIILLIAILYIFKIKRKLITSTFILIWFAFSLFNAFFSERAYPHYLLILAPSLSLICGLILWDKKYWKIISIFLIIVSLMILRNFELYDKSIYYYKNFISFIANKKSVTLYTSFFDKESTTDYEIALFLKSKVNNKDSIFVWGDNAQLYKMIGAKPTGKYIVAYHIQNYNNRIADTINAINKVMPKFIVIMPSYNDYIPFSLLGYSLRMKIEEALIYERIL